VAVEHFTAQQSGRASHCGAADNLTENCCDVESTPGRMQPASRVQKRELYCDGGVERGGGGLVGH
jgi:hypothetical protein